MKPEASEFGRVKERLIDHFGDNQDAQDFIPNEMVASLRLNDLVVSLREMERTLEKAKFNEEAELGLIRTSVMKIPKLAHFVIFTGCSDYVTEKQAVAYHQKGKKEFKGSPRDVVLTTIWLVWTSVV